MKRILIVDDEAPIRKWISYLCSEYTNESDVVVDSVGDGKSALEKFNRNRADIVFVDINMPVMDGLELIKRIRDVDSCAYVVVLTNFGEFDYAREAFDNAADLYVLKSEITEDYMARILEKAKETLEGRRAKSYKPIYTESMTSLKEEFYAGGGADFITKYDISFSDNSCFFIGFSNKQSGESQIEIMEMPLNHVLFIIRCKSEWVLCVSIDTQNSSLVKHQNVYNYVLKMSEANAGNICCYSEITELKGNMEKALFEAEKIIFGLKNRYYKEENIFFMTKKEYEDSLKNDLLITKEYLDIVDSFNLEKLGTFYEKAETFFGFIEKNPTLNIDYVISLAEKICEKVIYKAYGNDTEAYKKEIQRMRKLLVASGKMKEISGIVLNEIENIKSYVKEERYSPTINKVVEYIFENYGEIKSVQDIADYVNLNVDYMSRIFKKETEHNILNFLNNFRLKKAVTLLMNTDKKVYEISEEVGFADANYFSRKFREVYGISPYNYKNIISEKK